MKIILTFSLLFSFITPAFSQSDSVDVTFYYKPTSNPSRVYLPGEFNNWANNTNGFINPDPRWNMDKDSTGIWYKTVRLRVGGHVGGRVPGAYQYKFNENGSNNGWLNDPMNPLINPNDYNNSVLYVRDPTIHYLQPLFGSKVLTDHPIISAYIFPSTTTNIDTEKSRIILDGVDISSVGKYYDSVSKKLSFQSPALQDGKHVATIIAVNNRDQSSSDSTEFTVQAGLIQILTRSNDSVRVAKKIIKGIVLDTSITSVKIILNERDTLTTSVTSGTFSVAVTLDDKTNTIKAAGVKESVPHFSNTITINYRKNHTPKPVIMFGAPGTTISMNAFASTDPDGDPLRFEWRSEDERNPMPLSINLSGAVLSFQKPTKPGEYYFTLRAIDSTQYSDFARNYFTIHSDSSVTYGTTNSNPQWVSNAIIYEIFVPAFSSSGTLDAITNRIPYLKDLGINTIWLMPIMDNLGTINEMNGGYDIIDLYKIEPVLGSFNNFKTLIDSCHANKIRVILDITPNHVSQRHYWINDIRQWGEYSNYKNFIEIRVLGDDRGLGQYVTSYNSQPLYAHYDGWGLANLNLSDEECRLSMIDVLKFWLIDQNADGYRMDVYWGPQNRYGRETFWLPFREEMKRMKPEMFILGETDGTGFGSENNYSDGGGACDAGYDWNFYGQIKNALNTGNIDPLHQRISNYSPNEYYNYYTGINTHYLRFLENHDETRIAQEFRFDPQRTEAAAALIMMIPGIPMIYAGQEIGWTGRRDLINFKSPDAENYFPFYKRVTRLRTMFPALRTSIIKRVTSTHNNVYSFLRPYKDQNIVAAISFTANPLVVQLQIQHNDFILSKPIDMNRTYYLNDVINDTSFAINSSGLNSFSVSFAPFQSRVFVFSDTAFKVNITTIEEQSVSLPTAMHLTQNYPNPWTTATSFEVRSSNIRKADEVQNQNINYPTAIRNLKFRISLKVYDIFGREVLDLSDQMRQGVSTINLNESMLPKSGVYFYEVQKENATEIKKFIFMKAP